MKMTAAELKNQGIIDKIIPERGYFSREIVQQIKTHLIDELAHLSALPTEQLLEDRYQRFRKY